MDIIAAKRFVKENARPVDLAVYRYFFEGGPREDVVSALAEFQNEDGGFDITWAWGTPYAAEFEQARRCWRPRLTIDRLLFDAMEL